MHTLAELVPALTLTHYWVDWTDADYDQALGQVAFWSDLTRHNADLGDFTLPHEHGEWLSFDLPNDLYEAACAVENYFLQGRITELLIAYTTRPPTRIENLHASGPVSSPAHTMSARVPGAALAKAAREGQTMDTVIARVLRDHLAQLPKSALPRSAPNAGSSDASPAL